MKTLGQKLKNARLENGLTLQDVFVKTGLSVNYLSRVENDKVNITIGTLNKLAHCYNKTPGSFLDNSPTPNVRVVRRQQRHSLSLDRGAELQVLLADDAQNLEVILIELEPGNESAPMSHPGEKFIVAIKGKATISLDGTDYVLDMGDSIRFDSRIKHSWKNSTNENASFLVLTTPSRY